MFFILVNSFQVLGDVVEQVLRMQLLTSKDV